MSFRLLLNWFFPHPTTREINNIRFCGMFGFLLTSMVAVAVFITLLVRPSIAMLIWFFAIWFFWLLWCSCFLSIEDWYRLSWAYRMDHGENAVPLPLPKA